MSLKPARENLRFAFQEMAKTHLSLPAIDALVSRSSVDCCSLLLFLTTWISVVVQHAIYCLNNRSNLLILVGVVADHMPGHFRGYSHGHRTAQDLRHGPTVANQRKFTKTTNSLSGKCQPQHHIDVYEVIYVLLTGRKSWGRLSSPCSKVAEVAEVFQV